MIRIWSPTDITETIFACTAHEITAPVLEDSLSTFCAETIILFRNHIQQNAVIAAALMAFLETLRAVTNSTHDARENTLLSDRRLG